MKALTTNGITVRVEPTYQDKHSQPSAWRFIFSYRIHIENNSPHTVQLLRRHWFIVEGNGEVREVEGEGVVGKQPILRPGEAHQYSSWCPIRSDLGKMYGSFLMIRTDTGSLFEVEIPEFKLIVPAKLN